MPHKSGVELNLVSFLTIWLYFGAGKPGYHAKPGLKGKLSEHLCMKCQNNSYINRKC